MFDKKIAKSGEIMIAEKPPSSRAKRGGKDGIDLEDLLLYRT